MMRRKKKVVEEIWSTEGTYVAHACLARSPSLPFHAPQLVAFAPLLVAHLFFSYVAKLGVVVELIFKPLQKAAQSKTLVSTDQVKTIFANIDAILAHHKRFLAILSKKVSSACLQARVRERQVDRENEKSGSLSYRSSVTKGLSRWRCGHRMPRSLRFSSPRTSTTCMCCIRCLWRIVLLALTLQLRRRYRGFTAGKELSRSCLSTLRKSNPEFHDFLKVRLR
jgi:hypothetical protein